MNLLDDALFNLWKNGLCDENPVIMKSNSPSEQRTKISRAKQGLFDEEGEETVDDLKQ